MRAVLRIEVIGDVYFAYKQRDGMGWAGAKKYRNALGPNATRPWVARIVGLDNLYGLRREFLRCTSKDYRRANSIGSRGVFEYYTLTDGVYEVNRRISWRRTRRYFILVDGGEYVEVELDDVIAWLTTSAISG